MNIGLIGCGNISDTYFESQNIFNNLKIVACADIVQELADKKANQYNTKSLSVENLLNDKDIDIVLNLTIPTAHKEIILKSMEHGKHCFSEKPLAMNFKEGLEIKELSNKKKLFVGCAPDTFLGAAGQKARSLIEDNSIGNVVLGTFNIMSHGMEDWHPNPDFFFKPGGGPVFDLGVYYLTQLVNLNGPIRSVIATNATASNERIITSKPRYGEKISVETPTTLMGTLDFYNNSKIQFFCSWDIWKHTHSTIELYGLEGSMIVPDPNYFGGEITISNKDSKWEKILTNEMLLGKPNKEDDNKLVANYRGIGLSDMVNNIKNNSEFRCSIDLTLHVLEIMEGILESSKNSTLYKNKTSCKRPKFLDEQEIQKLKI